MIKKAIQSLIEGNNLSEEEMIDVMSVIMEQNPDISLEEIKKEIFLSFYGKEYNRLEIEKILRA